MDRSEHEPVGPLSEEARRTEQSLKQFQPRAVNLDRERLMFLAGQVAVSGGTEQHRKWFWPSATLAMSTVAACLLVALTLQMSRPPVVREIVREVTGPAPSPTLQAFSQSKSLPTAEPQYTSAPVLSLPASGVLQMRNTALRFGVEALPSGNGWESTTAATSTSPNHSPPLRGVMGKLDSSL